VERFVIHDATGIFVSQDQFVLRPLISVLSVVLIFLLFSSVGGGGKFMLMAEAERFDRTFCETLEPDFAGDRGEN
jgi:hypothetical protein